MHTRTARAIVVVPMGTKAGSVELAKADIAFMDLIAEAPRGTRLVGTPRLISTADTSTVPVIPLGQRGLMYEADFNIPD